MSVFSVSKLNIKTVNALIRRVPSSMPSNPLYAGPLLLVLVF